MYPACKAVVISWASTFSTCCDASCGLEARVVMALLEKGCKCCMESSMMRAVARRRALLITHLHVQSACHVLLYICLRAGVGAVQPENGCIMIVTEYMEHGAPAVC